jgi:hypothetical protein
MPSTNPHNTIHTLLYAIISHLTAPTAENTKEWQKIADLLPERPWGGDVLERWRRVEKRARVEKWLGEEEKEEDGMEGVEVRSGEKGQGKGSDVGRTKGEIGGEEGILRRSKRKIPEKDVDGEKSEEEEVVKEFEKVVRRMMRTAVGKRKLQLEEYGGGDYDCACAGKNLMDLVQANFKCGQKAKEGKALTGLLMRNLSLNWQPS